MTKQVDWRKYTAIRDDDFFCILCGEWQPLEIVTEHGTCQPCEEYCKRVMAVPDVKWVIEIVIKPDIDGYYVSCPSLKGCLTQGDTKEEALMHMGDALSAYMASTIKHGDLVVDWAAVKAVDDVEEDNDDDN